MTSKNSLKFNFLLSFVIFCLCNEVFALFYKLPSTIYPVKYDLQIHTLIHQNILPYNGSVSIDLLVVEPTSEIVLNSKDIEVVNLSLINLDSGVTLGKDKLKLEFNETKEQLRIYWQPEVPLELKVGQNYQLKINFVASIRERSVFGFFKTENLIESNGSAPIAVTQFEPTCARLAFPCFDDPVFKAKFIISITHGANYSAISNMPADGDPVLGSTPNGDMITTKFMETPPMSTYIVAFAVTNYNKSSVISNFNNVEHRFFYPSQSKNNGTQALENSVKTVEVLEKLLGVNYSLPKLDYIHVKESYGQAMENWGLMIFQETRNHNLNNKLELYDIVRVQNHEIAHQWFGNLVTPETWGVVWLKEGLSTYFGYIAADLVYPEEGMMDLFIINEVYHLSSLSLNGSLTSKVKEGDDVKIIYNSVSYQFGGSLIHMFHHAIGHETFMKGIFNYLSFNQFSVANEDDFFRALQSAVDENKVHLFQHNQSVENVMRTWTHNIGMPIVTIIRNYDTGTITIRQKSKSAEHKHQKWWIPLNFATSANPDFEKTVADYIMPPQAEVTLDLSNLGLSLSNSDWLIVNKKQTGIFYVVYDDLNLKLIREALFENVDNIHVLNRAMILRDLSVTLDEDLDSIEAVLGLLQYLKLEKEPLPWVGATNLMLKLLDRFEDINLSKSLENFFYDLSVEIFDKNYQFQQNQLKAIDLKAKEIPFKLKHQVDGIACQNYTTEMAKEYFLNGNKVSTNPCKLSLCESFKNVTFMEHALFFKAIFDVTFNAPKVYELQTALKCSQSEELFERAYSFFKTEQNEEFLLFFDDLITSNPFYDKWLQNYHKFTFMTEIDSGAELYRNKRIQERKNFSKKYENNLRVWLEKYGEKNSGKGNVVRES